MKRVPNELCDRKTAPVSKRAWDAFAGKANGFAAFKDGRRTVAKRANVIAWLEKTRQLTPAAAEAAELILDEDEAALQQAGIKLRVLCGGER